MFETVLRGGFVVEADGTHRLDLAISGGKVAARLAPGDAAEAQGLVDVGGKLLLPGLVDAHVHLREPGMTWKEDFASGSRAAIAGGVTTVLVMPTDDPWTNTPDELREKQNAAAGRLFCHAAFQIALSRGQRDLRALVRLGAISFEIFTADVPARFLHRSARDLGEAIRAVGEAGGVAAVSAGDQSLLEAALECMAPGRSTLGDFIESRSATGEAQGIAKTILAAAEAGVPVHIRQTTSRESIAVFRQLRSMADVSLETGIQGLIFTQDDYERLGPLAKGSPPWRAAADREALRQALADGTIDIVVTDHAPHALAEKLAHPDDFAAVPGGFPGVQTLLPALLSLVDEGLIDLNALVRVASTRPAERFGLGASKGRLAVGFDADIVVLDPKRRATVRNADQFSKGGYTLFDGLEVSASIERVFLLGREVVRPDGAIGEPAGLVLKAGA